MRKMVEALKIALDALENPDPRFTGMAIAGIKQALEARQLDVQDMLIVAYDAEPSYVTLDRAAADEYCKKQKAQYESLYYRVMDLSSFGDMAYSRGSDDGYQSGYDQADPNY